MARKLTTLFCAVAFSFTTLAQTPGGNPEPIPIVENENQFGQNGRGSLSYCTAWYYDSLSMVSVSLYGITEATVTLYDAQETVVDSVVSMYSSRQVLLSIPDIPGAYRIVISSSNYYGEGYFVVE